MPQAGDRHTLLIKVMVNGDYIYTGSAWVQVADPDSANTDAKTLTTLYTLQRLWNKYTKLGKYIGQKKKKKKEKKSVSVDVNTAFAGYSAVMFYRILK